MSNSIKKIASNFVTFTQPSKFGSDFGPPFFPDVGSLAILVIILHEGALETQKQERKTRFSTSNR